MASETSQKIKILQEIHHPVFDMVKRSDGVVVIETIDVVWFTLKEAKASMDAFKEITAGVPHLFLYLPGKHFTIDKDARSYYATEEALRDVIAMSVVLRNTAQRIASNLYMMVDKPVKPVKFFETFTDAYNWLIQQKPSTPAPAESENISAPETPEVKIVRDVRFPLFGLEERSDGIIQATTADDLFLTLNDAKAFIGAITQFTNGKPSKLLVIPGRHASIDKDFRSYIASPKALVKLTAIAFVLRNAAQRTIANAFLAEEKPIKPVMFFDETQEATEWLKKQLVTPELPPTDPDTLPAIQAEGITIVKEIHRPLFDMYLRSDGIIVLTTVDTAFFTMSEAHEFIAAQKEITGGVPHLLLGIPGRHVSVDSEMRSFMASEEALRYSIAEAYILRNMTQRGISNLLLSVDEPVKPMKFFENTEEAIRWLKAQKK